jgi:acyl-CoA thioester hydrolase
MARVKLEFPGQKPLFTANIPVRITDINYGNHLGNDALLSVLHEARMQFLAVHGWTELQTAGAALIMADLMVAYKNESFYGDMLSISLFVQEIGPFSFDLLYRIETARGDTIIDVAAAKTGMVCFDYLARKKHRIPEALLRALNAS